MCLWENGFRGFCRSRVTGGTGSKNAQTLSLILSRILLCFIYYYCFFLFAGTRWHSWSFSRPSIQSGQVLLEHTRTERDLVRAHGCPARESGKLLRGVCYMRDVNAACLRAGLRDSYAVAKLAISRMDEFDLGLKSRWVIRKASYKDWFYASFWWRTKSVQKYFVIVFSRLLYVVFLVLYCVTLRHFKVYQSRTAVVVTTTFTCLITCYLVKKNWPVTS